MLHLLRLEKNTGVLGYTYESLTGMSASSSYSNMTLLGNNLLLGSTSPIPYNESARDPLRFKLLPRVTLDSVNDSYVSSPTITGVAETPFGGPAIALAEVRDGVSGQWYSCQATDGNFDERSEEITCEVPDLSDGQHTLYVRATDEEGYSTDEPDYAHVSFDIITSGPLLNLDSIADIDESGHANVLGHALSISKKGYTETQDSVNFSNEGASKNWKSNDNSWEYTIANGIRLPFYDKLYDKFYVSSNGRICFGGSDTKKTGDLSHEDSSCGPFIAPFWGDVDTTNGDVSVLENTDGVTVTWEGTYANGSVKNGVTPGGTPQGWHEDSNVLEYELPSPFPFDGNTYTSVFISPDGRICFNANCTLSIDVLSVDLTTAGSSQVDEDIYITENSDHIIIRWKAETNDGNATPVNFESVLYNDGRIGFNYGDFGADLQWPAYPGIFIYKAFNSMYSNQTTFDNVNSTLFTYDSGTGTYSESLATGLIVNSPVQFQAQLQKDGNIAFSYGGSYDFSSSVPTPVVGLSKGDGILYDESSISRNSFVVDTNTSFIFVPDQLATIDSVEYQVDGTSGTWNECSPVDGTFDEFSEAFSCAPPNNFQGTHTIYVRAIDSGNNIGNQEFVVFSVGEPNPVSPQNSLLSATPNPVFFGQTVTTTLTSYDSANSIYHYGGEAVNILVSGANPGTPNVVDNADGTYTATYITTNPGTDLITATMNSVSVENDTDGTNDGIFNLIVLGTNPPPSNDPPILSNGSPSGVLAAGTTTTILSLDTNETATCKYSQTQNVQYEMMTGEFDLTGSTRHETLILGLTNESNYHFYIRCSDGQGGINQTDYGINFSIGKQTEEDEEKDHLTLIESKNDMLIFDALISKNRSEKENVSSDEDQDTLIRKVILEANNNKKIDGKFKIEKRNSKIKLPKDMTDKICSSFSQIEIKTYSSIDKDEIKSLELSFHIPENIRQNKKQKVFVFKESGLNTVLADYQIKSPFVILKNNKLEGNFYLMTCSDSEIIENPETITPTPTPEESSPESNDSNVDPPKEEVTPLIETQSKVLGVSKVIPLAITLSGIAAALFLFLRRLGSLPAVWVILREIGLRIYGFFIWKRNRKFDWGTVYDVISGQPIPLARVEIISEKSGKAVDFRITDSFGGYSFLVSPGTYFLNPQKEGFSKVTEQSILQDIPTMYANTYDYNPLMYNEYAYVGADLPMKRYTEGLFPIVRNKGVWGFIFRGIFWMGFIFSIYSLILSPGFLNAFIVSLYVLLEAVQSFGARKLKWGTVTDTNGVIQSFATVKLFSKSTGKLVSRSITNEKGQYCMIVNQGKYTLLVETASGKRQEKEFSFSKRGLVKFDMSIPA